MNYKSLIEEFKSEDITIKRHKELQKTLNDRANVIWKYILEYNGNNKLHNSWWAFSNDEHYDEGNGSDGGNFDSELYSEFVEIIGYYSRTGLGPYESGFPTKLMYDDNFEETIDSEIDKFYKKEKKKQKALEEKEKKTEAKKQALIKSAKAKLSKEEIKALGLK